MENRRRAVAVVDLGFGDAGKGLVTDHLTRALGATAVVRFNGGAQAGHNVVTADGRHHTFAQFGAGSFVSGVETFVGPEVVVHPTALAVEAEHLERQGVPSPLARVVLHTAAPCVTPLHQALGRLRELARGGARHGSCGVGVGDVAADLRDGHAVVRAGTLADGPALERLVRVIRDRKLAELDALRSHLPRTSAVQAELAVFSPEVVARWMALAGELAARVRLAEDAAWRSLLRRHRSLVLEGAQGILLDREHGFLPFTSPGDCTFEPAAALLADAMFDAPLERLGVLRAYAVRHGPGPLPGERSPPSWAEERHNVDGPWQGKLRVSPPDLVLTRYAARCSPPDALVITHLDRVLPEWAFVEAHDLQAPDGATLRRTTVPPFASLSLEARRAETARLLEARAVVRELRLEAEPGLAWARYQAEDLGVPLVLASFGPTSSDVRSLDARYPESPRG